MKTTQYFELNLYKKDENGEVNETLPPIHQIKIDAKYYWGTWASQIHSFYLGMFSYMEKNGYTLKDYKIRLKSVKVEEDRVTFTNDEIIKLKEIIREKYPNSV